MPIPYLGSKRKSASKIYKVIRRHSPNANTLVDLFCGGLAIGEIFLKNGWRVIANDKNKYVIALAKEVINGRFNDKVFTPKFVTRSQFRDVIGNPNKYEDWYVGYVQCVWSFGNNQKDYLFGKTVEPIKKAGHDIVIYKDPSELRKLFPQMSQKYIDSILQQDDWHKRRLTLRRVSRELKSRVLELKRLQQLQHLERLQQLEHLKRLQHLEQLQHLELFSLSYEQIDIPKEAVVYCDPPYKGRKEYAIKKFNHEEFWDWVRRASQTHDVYVSEYTAPDDFTAILTFPQKSTLLGGHQTHNNQPDENVFVLSHKLRSRQQ